MSQSVNILKETSEYVRNYLDKNLPEDLYFHDKEHTVSVVEATEEIANKEGVSDDEMEILLLSAWFHDTGYAVKYRGHEEESIKIAEEFLTKKDYPKDKLELVKECILSTDYNTEPQNKLQMILSDADLYHLSSNKFWELGEKLRNEFLARNVKDVKSDKAWGKLNKFFIKHHHYYTEYGKTVLEEGRQKNANILKEKLKKKKKSEKKLEKALEENEKLKAKLEKIKSKDNKPDRGIETMFRTTSKNHLDLSAIADNKANIMISINAIIISILMSIMIRKFEDYPNLIIPTIILVLVSLLTIVFAVLATRPNITKGRFKREDILNQRTNLLFFGNFFRMDLDEYEWGINQLMRNSELLYGSMTKDIYFLGKVLGRKYRLLRMAYTIFMFGLVISVLAYGAALFFFPVYH